MKYLLLVCLLPLSVHATPEKMAEAFYFEDALGSTECRVMVGNVIMNRAKDKRWPDTVTGVINQKAQFSYMSDGKPETIVNKKLYSAFLALSKAVLSGEVPDLTDGANHYLNHKISGAKWWIAMEFKGRCGDHWFYKG